ncbi:MAG TPA: hypothetical protein VMR25_26175 [Planctomycetaceae bacterium]|nr:hypothetical protein [Planctomycetaceae bacterium]
MALDAVIEALAMNRSPAAEKALQQMVTGEIATAGHSKQVAQAAVLVLAMRPSPTVEPFLLRIFTDPDEVIRPGDQGVYPAADLRTDTAHVLAKVGSPHLRLELAKIYTQSSTPPAVRSAIEEVLLKPATANFAAQVEVFRSAETPDALKDSLLKTLIEKNASAIKSALRLEGDSSAPAAGGGSPFSAPSGGPAGAADSAALLANAAKMLGSAGAIPGLSSTITAPQNGKAPALPAKPGAASPAASTLAMMALEMMGKMQSMQPVDAGIVARELWKPDFVEAIAKKLADDKADETALVSGLASLPTKLAREKLKEVLHKDRSKGPQDFGKVEAAKASAGIIGAQAAPVMTRRRAGKHKKDDEGGFGADADQGAKAHGMQSPLGANIAGQPQSKAQVVEFGKDWFDPGSLVVLKTAVTYEERLPEKKVMRRPMYNLQARVTPAMERRQRAKADKQKLLESQYEWRDAIEKAVRQWDERLTAVAEAPSESPGAAENSADSDEKVASGPAKTGSKDSSKTSKSAPSKSTQSKSTQSKSVASKTPGAAPAPTPSAAMPFAMHAGGKIAKEYHLRWPQDLAASFGSAQAEPLAVDYVRLEGIGDLGKALTHYRGAIASVPSGKSRTILREVENGKWLDTVQTDQAGHRTRSIDVIATREPSDDDSDKKSGQSALTVEILFVEIETPGSEATTPGNSKKEPRETTSTTTP